MCFQEPGDSGSTGRYLCQTHCGQLPWYVSLLLLLFVIVVIVVAVVIVVVIVSAFITYFFST